MKMKGMCMCVCREKSVCAEEQEPRYLTFYNREEQTSVCAGGERCKQRWVLLPGACSEGCCQSCEYPPEEGVRVFPCNDEVDGRQHKKAMDGMSNDTAGDVFSQTGKQLANIVHLNNLASYEEHDTNRGIPVEGQECYTTWKKRKSLSYCSIPTLFESLLAQSFLPHDPGHQYHGGLVEGVEELDKDLPLLSQLPQSHTKHNGKHNQTQDVHAVLVCTNGNLWETYREPWKTQIHTWVTTKSVLTFCSAYVAYF